MYISYFGSSFNYPYIGRQDGSTAKVILKAHVHQVLWIIFNYPYTARQDGNTAKVIIRADVHLVFRIIFHLSLYRTAGRQHGKSNIKSRCISGISDHILTIFIQDGRMATRQK